MTLRSAHSAKRARGAALLCSCATLPAALAACGGHAPVAPVSLPSVSPAAELAAAVGRTLAAGSARFSLEVAGSVAGVSAGSSEQGTLSFRTHVAHIYRLVPGSGVPQELIVRGAVLYTNANAAAALADPSIRPWTRLDTRLLPPAQRTAPDDIDHVLALAYLADGATGARRLAGAGSEETRLRGLVVPSRVVAHLPARERAVIGATIASDYAGRPFPAQFWLDRRGRVVRVLVSYRTPGGGRIRVEGAFSDFGTGVDLRLPPAREIVTLTP